MRFDGSMSRKYEIYVITAYQRTCDGGEARRRRRWQRYLLVDFGIGEIGAVHELRHAPRVGGEVHAAIVVLRALARVERAMVGRQARAQRIHQRIQRSSYSSPFHHSPHRLHFSTHLPTIVPILLKVLNVVLGNL
jgi:hypothetical protein